MNSGITLPTFNGRLEAWLVFYCLSRLALLYSTSLLKLTIGCFGFLEGVLKRNTD